MAQPALKLQSYKVDNQALLTRIGELNQLKVQLQNSLSKQKFQENQVSRQISTLRQQNSKLKQQIDTLTHSQNNKAVLIQKLQKKLTQSQKRARQFKSKYEAQQHGKREIKQYYEHKVNSLLHQKQQMVSKYQEQISNCQEQISNYEQQISRLSTIKPQQKLYESNMKPYELHSQSRQSIQTYNSIGQNSQAYDSMTQSMQSSDSSFNSNNSISSKKIKRLKKSSSPDNKIQPKSPQPKMQSRSPESKVQPRPSANLSEKYLAANTIPEKQEDSHLSGQDLYLQMIRQLYKSLVKIEIKSSQLTKLPQMDSFSKLKSPSRNDLKKLLKTYPLHIKEQQKGDLIYDFMIRQSERRGQQPSGKFIVQQIVHGIKEMEVIYESNQPKQKRFSIGQTTSGHKISGISSGIDSELHSNDSYF